MGGVVSSITSIFKGVKPVKPDPSIGIAQAAQEKRLAKQEKRQSERQAEEARRIGASRKARQTGGLRMLLSSDREDAMLGLDDKLGR